MHISVSFVAVFGRCFFVFAVGMQQDGASGTVQGGGVKTIKDFLGEELRPTFSSAPPLPLA